jgi:carbamoyl-phosphate synthase large subunit
MKVLFTNAGRRTYIVQFALDLIADDYPLEVHVSDCSPLSAAMHVAPCVKAHLLPPVLENSEAYVKELFELAKRQRLNVIFPLSDLDPKILSEHRDWFAQIGCTIVVSDSTVIARCNDKRLTYDFCREAKLPTPESWFSATAYNGPFPVIKKHVFGSGSSGLKRIENRRDLDGFVCSQDMLQRFINGEEFGLDVLNDLDGNFVAVCVKRKLLMRAGETDKSEIVHDVKLIELGRLISAAFRHVGNLDCDVLRGKDGSLYCIDFNPRFGGGYPATHVAGYNYLKAVLNMVMKQPYSIVHRPKNITVMKGISVYWCDS